MKSFSELRKQPESLTESSPFIDPPVVLVLRRKAVRLFPGGQRVATYRNDNLHLEVAIPYNPETLGKQATSTVGTTSESVINEEAPEVSDDEKIAIIRKKFKSLLVPDESKLSELDQALKNWLESEYEEHGDDLEDWDENVLDDNYQDLMALLGVNEDTGDNLFGMYLKHAQSPRNINDPKFRPHKHIEHVVRQRYGEKALTHFKAAAGHYMDGDTENANHHYAKYKHHTTQLGEENIMEATIHSLHAITKTKHPAQVKFRSGASAMVHHETAAQIMKLHSKMNAANKRKIEGLVNSSPDGLKKVIEFATVHMK